jgi:outer membrane receptor protein involved in Fe transport
MWQSASAAQRLGMTFAYRSSDYSSVGRFDSGKVGLDFQLFRDLRLRATQSRDVREATFTERFDNAPAGGSVLDPTRNQAQSTITITTVGNPSLIPESADTTVFGLVYQPGWAQGLRMSVDRWAIDISDSIATLGAQRVVDECYFNNVLCEYVFRDNLGVLSRVGSPYLNLALARAEGTDIEIAYSRDVDWFAAGDESLSIRMLGGKLDERSNTVVGSAPAEFAGTRGYPDATANLTVSYRVSRWSVQLQERFIDDVILNRLWIEGIDVDDNTIDSEAWTNLVLAFQSGAEREGSWRISFNVQNLFDEDPPIIASAGDTRFGAQATDNTYDEWGRRYELGFSMEF